ncbi:hypothetical protein GYB22_08365 [bacterium]|nr:hypothetical protein [bacterium]
MLGTWINIDNPSDSLFFYPNEDSSQVLLSFDGSIPTFMFNSEYGYVDTSGLFLMWGGYTSMIRMEDDEVLYFKFQTLDRVGEHRYTHISN